MDRLRRRWATVRLWWGLATVAFGVLLRAFLGPGYGYGVFLLSLVVFAIVTFVVDPKRVAREGG